MGPWCTSAGISSLPSLFPTPSILHQNNPSALIDNYCKPCDICEVRGISGSLLSYIRHYESWSFGARMPAAAAATHGLVPSVPKTMWILEAGQPSSGGIAHVREGSEGLSSVHVHRPEHSRSSLSTWRTQQNIRSST